MTAIIPLSQYALRRSLGRKNKPVRKISPAWAMEKYCINEQAHADRAKPM